MADPTAVDNLATQIASIESGGHDDPYSVSGPVTASGDRAIGKYQIMGANVPQWTTEALGSPMTPDDFAANPDAQERTAKFQLGKLFDQYGNPRDVASVWHSGVPYDRAVAEGRKDQLGTTTQSYADRVAAAPTAPPTAPAAPAEPAGQPVIVALPDGSSVDLGVNPTPELRAAVKAKILAKFPELNPNASVSKTTAETTSQPTAQPAQPRLRDMSLDDTAAAFNTALGNDPDHWTGKYVAAVGKPATDALQDMYEVLASPPPGDTGEALQRALQVMHPLAVPGEAAGNVAEQAINDAGGNPTAAKIIGTLVGLVVGAKTPLPGLGEAAPAARVAGEAESAAAQEATRVAEAAAAKTAPSTAAATEATSALTPSAPVTGPLSEQLEAVKAAGGQATRAGVAQRLEEVKEPVQGIYNAITDKYANIGLADPAKRQAIVDGIDAVEEALGPTFAGQPKAIFTELRDKILKGELPTYEDLEQYKSQLDSVLPGRLGSGATPRDVALHKLKLDVRDTMRSMVGDTNDRDWLTAADTMWRDQVIGRDNPLALGNLARLVRKTPPDVVVERLFGGGTTDKAGAMAKAVLGELGEHSAAGALRQSVFARMMTKASDAAGNLDPKGLLKQWDDLNGSFRAAISNPGAETFFESVRTEQGVAERAAAWAKAAQAAAKDASAVPASLAPKWAHFIAGGIRLGAIATAHNLGAGELGSLAAGAFIPAGELAHALTNPRSANLLARAIRTPVNSAIVPTILQQLKNAGIGIEPQTGETPP